MLLAGMYGGYFGAAQGVLLMGLLSVLLTDPLQRLNAVKNVLGTIVNAVAAVTFMVVAWDRIEWPVAGLLAVGGIAGGYLGARVGRRLPPPVLRGGHRPDRRRGHRQDGRSSADPSPDVAAAGHRLALHPW